ncbi:MAG: F0F1 ATP synthase subunit B [Actinomycetes bacterium]|jgi:F-type H+-transporting ATPase subunit b|nr:F0F1 ATP synthase subunit B [Candidatus Nanopelagicales bacterium]MDP4825624.1 F0F1 ATP synthase subunit B [Candidatus Nanopelagicales bacterium]MDP4887985.1 F0F1 ATP synthase subunit B [Candidatus Nanopelagicales bacterium]
MSTLSQGLLIAAGENEPMPSVLAVPIDELIVGIFGFLVVFGVLAKVALPRIKAALEERTNAIEGGIERAEAAQADAEKARDEYRAALAQAREEAAAIRTQAQSDRTAIVDEARTEARAAAATVTAAAEAQLAAERAQATAALTRQVGDMALTLATKIVGQGLADDARVRATVDDFLDSLEQSAREAKA